MYGASAQLVITMKGGTVNGFTLVGPDPHLKDQARTKTVSGQRPRRIHPNPPQHDHPPKARHLLRQRRKLALLGPKNNRLLRLPQTPCPRHRRIKIQTLQLPVHRIYGRRRIPHTTVRRDFCVSSR